MTPEFEVAREQILLAQIHLERALEIGAGFVPLDDRESYLDQVRLHQASGDQLVMWLAHYGRPGVDPALVIEDLVDDAPAAEPEA
jgi:hypothetical protein